MMVSAMTLETAAVPDELQAALLERIDAGDIELPHTRGSKADGAVRYAVISTLLYGAVIR